jgi:hypothetical protein
MKLANVDAAIKRCEEHLNSTGTKGSEIESILTKYLLVYICGAYETEIKNMITLRAARTGDKEVESFVKNTVKAFRSLKIDDIKGSLLGRFSDGCKSIFDSKIHNTEAEIRYSNIITNRHLVAHGSEINITFDELVTSYQMAGNVLAAIKEALGIDGVNP